MADRLFSDFFSGMSPDIPPRTLRICRERRCGEAVSAGFRAGYPTTAANRSRCPST